MQAIIKKSVAYGNIYAIPSKSYFHRHILASLLAKGNCTLEFNQKACDISLDIKATLNCAKALGISYELNDFFINLKPDNISNKTNPILDCNESGSTLRFILPIALLFYDEFTVVGSKKLMERGIKLYEDLFTPLGITFTKTNNSQKIKGKLKAGKFSLPGNVSSQYITGLLFTLPLLDGDSLIEITQNIESKPYIDITIDVLKQYGIKVDFTDNFIYIKGHQTYKAGTYQIEGDYSNAAIISCFNEIGGNVLIKGLKENSLQGDKVFNTLFKKLDEENQTIDISNCIDLGPILFTLSAIKNGAHFKGVKRLRIKESDRLYEVLEELKKLGTEYLIINDDECIIKKANLNSNNLVLNPHNDHRQAMSFSVLLSMFGGKIDNCECVAKSYPSFYEDIKKLHIDVEIKEE